MAGIRLHTFWSILRNYVLEAIQTRTMSNFGAFYYMFIVNVGLYKEPEFAPTKIHQKLKQKHASYLENTKIVQPVCTEVLFVLDWKKTQVRNVFPIQISVFFCSSSYRIQVDPWDKLLLMLGGPKPPSCGQRRLWSDWADPSFLHADSEDFDQTKRMPRLIWVFAGRTVTLLVLSCRGSMLKKVS